jgi:serine/threonine protein kinase
MELCALNLDAYIQRKWTTRVLEGLPQFVKVDTLPIEHQLEQIRLILSNITNGVAFLHSRKTVHRDLKPANGINPRRSI